MGPFVFRNVLGNVSEAPQIDYRLLNLIDEVFLCSSQES